MEEEKRKKIGLKEIAKYLIILFVGAMGFMLLFQGEFLKAIVAFVVAFVWTDTFDRLLRRLLGRREE